MPGLQSGAAHLIWVLTSDLLPMRHGWRPWVWASYQGLWCLQVLVLVVQLKGDPAREPIL